MLRVIMKVEGDFEGAFRLADHLIAEVPKLKPRLKLGLHLARLRFGTHDRSRSLSRIPFLKLSAESRKHSESRDRLAITYHYDLSNDFFALWLDPRMVYSCGYFASPEQDLTAAQLRKLDLVCQKLQLQTGESFLDIGCGWGGLIIRAAQE